MLLPARDKPRREAGATMVEFALALTMLIFFLGSFFDIGLGIHNLMLLRTVTMEASRQVAVNFVTSPHCENISTYLKDKATVRLHKDLLADTKDGKMRWSMNWISPPASSGANALTFPVIRITGSFKANCYFVCNLLPQGWTLSASSEAVIERELPITQSCTDFTLELSSL